MTSRVSIQTFLSAVALAVAVEPFQAAEPKGWKSYHPAGPSPRGASHGSLYDFANNRLVLLLESNPAVPGRPASEVWVLSNANGLGGSPTWTQLAPTGTAPSSNSQSSAVYDRDSNRLIVYGGCSADCSPALSEVSVLTNANGLGGAPAWSQSVVTNPQERVGHTAALDPLTGSMIAFGGNLAAFGTDQNDTRVLSDAAGVSSPSTWTTLAAVGGPPPIRTSHSAVYDPFSNRLMVMGGENLIGACCPYDISNYNDVWVLSNANGASGTPTWTQLAPAGKKPSPRAWHSAVYDQPRNRILVFGGQVWSNPGQNNSALGDLWELTNANGLGTTPKWKQLGQLGHPPGANYYHVAGFDRTRRRMIVFGGANRDQVEHNWLFVLQL
jgi:hypothetical protein